MDKNQYDIFLEVLRRLDKTGVLSNVVLIGSWCLPLYRDYYSGEGTLTALRTRDIDFLVSRKEKIKEKVDLQGYLRILDLLRTISIHTGSSSWCILS